MAKILRTPLGTAVYPWLKAGKPDTRFDADGVYKVNLNMEDGEDLQELVDVLEEARDEYVAELQRLNPKKKKVKIQDLPIDEEEDGTKTLKFKMKARVKTKKGDFTQSPAIFDSKGKPMLVTVVDEMGNKTSEVVDIRGGSKLRVAFEPIVYENPMLGVGVSLRLKAVQVQELVSFGEQTATSFGFGEIEGHEHEAVTVKKEVEAEAVTEDEFGEDDF